MPTIRTEGRKLAVEAGSATAAAGNEATLRHSLENALHNAAIALRIPWYPLQLDEALPAPAGVPRRFVDVAHGAVVIEYERPRAFRGREGEQLRHAKEQAEEYGKLIASEEGRDASDYSLVAWDGSHIAFGSLDTSDEAQWEALLPFDASSATRLLDLLKRNGRPIVHPVLINAVAGPQSAFGTFLIPALFRSVRAAIQPAAGTSKTFLLFTEWRRLFGQVAGTQSDRLRALLREQERQHHAKYTQDPAAYLFSLNTYIALVAKLVAAMAMPNAAEDIRDARVPIQPRMERLEDGSLFSEGGVTNMVAGDFFSWYLDDPAWPTFEEKIHELVSHLAGINFDVSRKNPESTRDLFKGIYQKFVPAALRHALGEYYTPDWLASHALDQINWQPGDTLLDPTCGTGTFVLEALKRRQQQPGSFSRTAKDLLHGLYGLDLNPLAVLAARASLVVSLGARFDPADPVTLPIYLADAINTAEEKGELFTHQLQTERGVVEIVIPATLVRSTHFFDIFSRTRELVVASLSAQEILQTLAAGFAEVRELTEGAAAAFFGSLEALTGLHGRGWDGIWCAILADRFRAGSIDPVTHIAGNPPWVKWSHLPPEYAQFIKPRCLQLGVFSEDRWVGGIESDISTVVTYESIDKWLAPRGQLAFLITGTVFANESSQGFRRFELKHRGLVARVVRVEDFSAVAPFEGVANFPTLLILRRGAKTSYPVPYRIWKAGPSRDFADGADFRARSDDEELLAAPVPGTDAGPWIKGTREDHELWSEIFGTVSRGYIARKGITTDRNGIFFVRLLAGAHHPTLQGIENDPSIGKTQGIPRVRSRVEKEHLFPLLRGRGVAAFRATPDETYRVLVPQRAMHGDPALPVSAPGTFRFLRRFETELRGRSSYKRFQRNQPYWSLWSTGTYTFSPFKVVWKEMSGGRFVAASIGSFDDPVLGRKIVIPDHKVYFVPVATEDEAAFLCGLLNAPAVSRAIGAYAAQLSLGVSVIEYLKIPRYSKRESAHRELAKIAKRLTREGRLPSAAENRALDALALSVLRQG